MPTDTHSAEPPSFRTLRARRYLRLIRRAREVPPSFLARKGFIIAAEPGWNLAYRLNATRTGNVLLHDLVPGLPASSKEDLTHTSHGAEVVSWPPDEPRSALLLRESQPEVVRSLIERADRARARHVPILGFGELHLGEPIDWHRDYISGARWTRTAALRLDFVRPLERSDVKVPWELNRLQFLPWLGQGWLLTGNRGYVASAAEIVTDWIASNPVGIGIAWSCSMEAAIRGMNLLTALRMLRNVLDDPTRAEWSRTLRVHLQFLRRHPELSDVNGNHYLVDLAGIVQLGLATNHTSTHQGWLTRAIREFTAETLRQFHPDGVHVEHSTNYHRLVAEIVLSTLIELGRAGRTIDPELADRAERAMEFLIAIAGREGHIPLIGDADSGQGVILGCRNPNDVRGALATAALFFHRDDLSADVPALPPESVWQLGPNAVARWTSPVRSWALPKHRLFADGGFVMLESNDSKVVARCGDPGLFGRGGHDHSDLTSFTAEMKGVPVILDPGSSTYTGDPSVRRREIAAGAHNMLLIDDKEPAAIVTGSVMDVISPGTRGRVVRIGGDSATDPFVTMTHDGYEGLPGVSGYRRTLRLSDGGRTLECVECIDGAGVHRLCASFYLDPRWSVRERGDRYITLEDKNGLAGNVTISPEPAWERVDLRGAQIAPLYGKLISTLVVQLETQIALPAVIRSRFTYESRSGT